jgi:hypothetical protein
VLASRAAHHVALDKLYGVAHLLDALRQASVEDQARTPP